MKFKVLGVCGGNGVILHPFRNNLIRNIEPRSAFKTPNDVQWKLNFEAPLQTRISPENEGLLSDRITAIIGAPDCGHSSVLSFSRAKKLGNPRENLSLNTFIQSVGDYEPNFFLMENLPKLLSSWGKDFPKLFPNYRLQYINKSVSAWGNSQVSRVRLVVVGVNRRLASDYDEQFTLPKQPKLKTCKELLKGLRDEDPCICNIRESLSTRICLYYRKQRNITAAEAQELWLTEFRNEKRWPVNMPRMKNQPGVYRNFAEDHPLTVRKQNRQFNHRGLMLTPREIARIQGVPDDFYLWYEADKHQFCINKARTTCAKTPPYEIGQWFYDILNEF
jgi:site-specific DNA-cytosine methylase